MTFVFEGRRIESDGQTSVAAALLKAGEPNGLFCAIGVCFGCLVTVNGKPGQRGCLTYPEPGDVISRDV